MRKSTAVAPQEKNKWGRNDVIFYGVIRNSDKQVNYVFGQVSLCVAAYLFTPFLRKCSVLHWIILINKKHLNYIYDLRSCKSRYTLPIHPLTDNTAQRINMISW